MKLSFKVWLVFLLLASIGFWGWHRFGYPHYKFLDLSVDKKEALQKAKSYLQSRGVDPGQYKSAVVFSSDDWSDRYLQKTIGLQEEEAFIAAHNLELFSWNVRFFKELQKEEYGVSVSPKKGEIVGFSHLIEDIEARTDTGKEAARKIAEEFLKQSFGMDLAQFDFHEEKANKYDNRVDYTFSWEKKNVYIPWKKNEGGAKVLIGALISGQEVRHFYKNSLDIPEKFIRFIENALTLGEYLSGFSILFFILFFSWSVYIAVKRKSDVITQGCRKWYFLLFVFMMVLHGVSAVNSIEMLVDAYPTSVRLQTYFGLTIMKFLINLTFLSVAFIFPGIAGESLRAEVFPEHPYSGFWHYLRSTFYSRSVASSVVLGYLLFFMLIGLQAVLFFFGQKYLGVWKEWMNFTHLSSALIPFVSALVVGVFASLNEEIVFRLFGMSWAQKYFRNRAVAILLPACIWGFGHASYPVFPAWFRGIEVTIIGLVYGVIFIRFGLIPLIVAHYLFDVFWGVAAFILGHTTAFLFIGSLAVLLLPLVWALVAFLRNRPDTEREIKIALNATQVYNLEILSSFIEKKRKEGLDAQAIKAQLLTHNWDLSLVELAIKRVYQE